jgi:hypothetical protein
MAVNINILSQKFYDQFKNDVNFASNPADFTLNLAGSVMEQIQIIREFDVSWNYFSSASNPMGGISELSPGVLRLELGGGKKWRTEGFAVGDDILITWQDASASQNNTGTITSINNSVAIISWSGFPIPGNINGWINNTTKIHGISDLTALDYYFGLVDNSETTVDPKSKVSGHDQGYYAAGIGAGGPRSTAFVNMNILSLSSDQGWVTNSARIRYVSSTISDGQPISQKFELEHIITINPWYLDGELNNLLNNIIPNDLTGANSYKYVFKALFKTALSNPNTEKKIELTSDLGSVAWFNENFNGYNNLYQINSIVYTEQATGNPANGLLISSKTRVTIQVQSNARNFVAGERVGVYASYLPDQSEYDTTPLTNMFQNFLYDNALGNSGAAGINGQYFITNLTTFSPSGNLMTLFFDVEYTGPQKSFLAQKLQNQPTYFLIGVQLGDVTALSGDSDKLIILADVELYDESADIPGLIEITKFDIYPHNQQIGAGGFYSDYEGWNEDGVVIDFEYKLNLLQNAYQNSLVFKLLAFNNITNQSFELDSFDFPNIATSPVSLGVQQLNANTTRGYNLAAGDQFNFVKLQTGALIGTDQYYSGTIGQKIKWQDWIKNLNVDNIFFNAAFPNNNKNYRSSNYSDLNDYTIRLAIFSNVDGVSTLNVSGNTNYLFLSAAIPVYDYDLDGNVTPVWSAIIETFHPTTLVNLQGAVLVGGNTIMRTTWTNSGGPVASVLNMWAIHRIEETNQNGDAIDELSTINPYPVPNRVIPLITETQLKIDPISGNVVTECLVDGSQILTGKQYNLSARLQDENMVEGKLTEQSVVKETEASQIKIVE